MATEYGKRLRQARKHAGLNQTAAAKKTGIPQSTISTAERLGNGSGDTPIYAKAYGVSAHWLATGEGVMTDIAHAPPAIASITPSHQTLDACLRVLGVHLAQLSTKGKVHAKLALSALVDDPEDVEGACATIQAQIGLANEAVEIGRQPKFISSGK